MKNIKIIVTDLDSTLLRDDKTISDYTAGIFNKCWQNGIKIVFATARPKRVTIQYLEQIPADILIMHNGAVIYSNNEQIFHCGISPDVTKNIMWSVNHDFPGATVSVEIDDTLYINSGKPKEWDNTKAIFTDLSDFDKLSEYFPDKPAEKIIVGLRSVNIPLENQADITKPFEKYLNDDLYAETNSEGYIFIMNRGAKKASAVKFLSERYGCAMSEIAAFGDDYNDIEMIKHCGIGVAVSNAIDEVKSAADFICESNDSNGVAKWIENNIL